MLSCQEKSRGQRPRLSHGNNRLTTFKVKTNPYWNIYSKAYKQHYARYMKKKMSQAEFAEWADYALDLRSKAENGEIEFEVYEAEIRK